MGIILGFNEVGRKPQTKTKKDENPGHNMAKRQPWEKIYVY